jgi:adiponectin receptor
VHLRDNVHIHTGYRVDYSYTECALSLLHVHNETGNIWTHLLPFALFASWIAWSGWMWEAMLVQVVDDSSSPISPSSSPLHPLAADAAAGHWWIVALYLTCNCITFLTSALFHTNMCHKRSEVFAFFGCLDYTGISTTICGSTCAVAYYLYFCQPWWQRFWIATLALPNLVGVVGPMFRFWGKSEFRGTRTMIYILSATISAAPVLQYALVKGLSTLPVDAVRGVLLMAAFDLGGAFLYVHQWPERFFPGQLDFWFNSHQFWHICVVAATYCHLTSILALARWRIHEASCPVLS